MKTREQLAAEVRAAHADWTDEQVTAEAERLHAAQRPDPPKPDDDRDRAFAEQRRKADEAERRAKAAEDALAERERKEAEEQGRWKELAESEKARADKLEAERETEKAERLAERAATDLKFRDTGYALYRLKADRVDLNDPAAVKTALEGLAQANPEMTTGFTPPPSGGPHNGSGDPPPKLTAAQLSAMSPAQIAKLDPKVVNEALAAG